jgi:hypothetical protein
MYLPASAACQLVPQAAMLMRWPRKLLVGDLHLAQKDLAGVERDAAQRGVT